MRDFFRLTLGQRTATARAFTIGRLTVQVAPFTLVLWWADR